MIGHMSEWERNELFAAHRHEWPRHDHGMPKYRFEMSPAEQEMLAKWQAELDAKK